MKKPYSYSGLYAITDSTLLPNQALLVAAVEAALTGGASIIQYRDKSVDQQKRRSEATALQALCRRYQRPLLINDDVELAVQVGAHGVHLGQGDSSVAEARRRLGDQAIIGVTCHDSLPLALQAISEGADYVAFGAFFVSTTKPGARPAPLSLLTEARRCLNAPVVAIGGITRDNAPTLINQGADMLAVIGDLFTSADIATKAQSFSRLFH